MSTDEISTYIASTFSSFRTKPILFIGSGFSIRYLNSPTWKKLLSHFSEELNVNNPLSFRKYEEMAIDQVKRDGLNDSFIYPLIASFIQNEFNHRIFNDNSFYTEFRNIHLAEIKDGNDPFHLAIIDYIKEVEKPTNEYNDEYKLFTSISKKISNIITTNYDSFLEDTFTNFHTIIGQQDILNKRNNLVGNIYKIHGSVSDANSIVITKEDYDKFLQKQKFLSAKILTMLLEFPVIFIGYSASDTNIISIFSDIKSCLNPDTENDVAKKLLFIDYTSDKTLQAITEIEISGLRMTRIRLSDFSPLYKAFENIIDSIDISYLRSIEDKIIQLIETTNKTVPSIYASALENDHKDKEPIAIYIGHNSSVFSYGYASIGILQYCEDVLFEKSNFDPIGIIEHSIVSQRTRFAHSKLPIWKYLDDYEKPVSLFVQKRAINRLIDLYSRSEMKMKLYNYPKDNISDLISENLDKSLLNIYLCLQRLDINEVESYIKKIWQDVPSLKNTTTLSKIVCAIDFARHEKRKSR